MTVQRGMPGKKDHWKARFWALLAAAALVAGGLLFVGAGVAAAAPKVVTAPTVSGTMTVGSTISVTQGTWTSAHPLTFAYTWQDCNASGASCVAAKGLWASGARPAYLLTAADAGHTMVVTVKATDPNGSKSVATAATPVIAAYPVTSAPLVQFVNGLPDNPSYSSSSIFQFQTTGTGVTTTCQLDSAPAVACPSTDKITYSGLAPGQHTVTVTAQNAAGPAVPATYTWQVDPLPPPVDCSSCYHPPLATTWQWQLTPDSGATTINTTVVADMYDIDGFDNTAATVATLHSLPGTTAAHRSVLCYFSAGTLENWRPDAEAFPADLLGNTYPGFSDERWLDIRQLSVLGPLLEARMDMCQAKGFDGFEFDNVDAWDPEYNTGLNLTAQDELAFIAFLANQAHLRGMSMALKNDLPQIPAALPYVDFAVNEQCFQYKECLTSQNGGVFGLDQMVAAGKAVFETEYKAYSATNNVCTQSIQDGFSTIYKHPSLNSYRVSCR
jgi:hypothetical protein